MAQQRRKHVPLRTCIACRQQRPKRAMIRIVRSPEGTLAVDAKGKSAGRGAYLCPAAACWDAALQQGRLARALKCRVTEDQVQELRSMAAAILDQQAVDDSGRPE
jgi:predicted RNA-binding protein YlxR (DUF448 family)